MNYEHVKRLLEELKTLNDNFSRVMQEKGIYDRSDFAATAENQRA
jgi:hypothetical protein